MKSFSHDEIGRFVRNLNIQKNVIVVATIVLSSECTGEVLGYLDKNAEFKYKIHEEMKITRATGFYIEKYAEWDRGKGYLCLYSELSEWMSRHLYWLVSTIHNHSDLVSQSGFCLEDHSWEGTYKSTNSSEAIKYQPLNSVNHYDINFDDYCASSFLIKKEFLDRSNMCVIANIDQITWFAFVVLSYQSISKLPMFVPKISLKILPSCNEVNECFENNSCFSLSEDKNILSLSYGYSENEKNLQSIINIIKDEDRILESSISEKIRSVSEKIRDEVDSQITYKYITKKLKRSLRTKNSLLSRLALFLINIFTK